MNDEITRPRIRVAAIIKRDDTLLMVRHQKGDSSYWLLPGGGVNRGETLEQALCRELEEEAKVTIQPGGLVYINDAIAQDGSRHIVQCTFIAEITGGVLGVGSDERVVEVRYVSCHELDTIVVHPPLKAELIQGLQNGFSTTQTYLGNRWMDSPTN